MENSMEVNMGFNGDLMGFIIDLMGLKKVIQWDIVMGYTLW